MGVVYKARHLALNRLVALKMILAGSNAPARHRTRFRREAEVVARLRHPNIVQIYDIGEADGQCYLALEYVEGGSVRERLDGRPMEARRAARLLEPLARAVQHAHRQGIVHRDLKPANILLAPTGDSIARGNAPLPDYHALALESADDRGSLPPLSECTPKLTDFGLARMLDYSGPMTEPGMAAGTPQYMAPEQATGEPDARESIDVWALGVTLYELLTGRPPFRAATAVETLRLIRDADPVPPSQLAPGVPRDLETICLKCLEKDPARRYPGARELADDLQRFSEGEAIHARRVGRLGRLTKWAARRPLLAGLAALLLGGLLAGVAGSAGGTLHIVRRWREASQGRQEALAGWKEQEEKAQEAEAARGQAEKARRDAEEQAAWLLLGQAQDYGARGDADRAAHDLLAGLRLVSGRGPLDRVFRANLAGWLSRVHPLEEVFPVPQDVLLLARAKGGRLVVAGADGTVRSFDREGKPLGQVREVKPPIRFLSLSEDGNRALVGAGDQAVVLALGRAGSAGEPIDATRVLDGVLSPDGKIAFTGGEDGVVRRRAPGAAPAGADLSHPAPARRLALSPDGRSLAVALSGRPEVWVWNLAARPPTHRVVARPRAVTALAFHPDGRRLWAGDAAGVVRLLDARSGGEVGVAITLPAEVRELAPTPDGQRLLTVPARGPARLWDVAGGLPVGTFPGTAACLGADGSSVAVAMAGEVRIHGLARPLSRPAGGARPPAPWHAAVASVASYPEGKRLLLGEVVPARARGLAWPRDVKPGQSLPGPWRHRLATVPCVALAPGGKVAATVCRQGRVSAVCKWDAETGKLLFDSGDLEAAVEAVTISPFGEEIAAGDDAGGVRFWRGAAEQPPGKKVGGPVRCLAYSPDGETLAVGTEEGGAGSVYYLDRKSSRKANRLPHGAPVTSLTFAPDGNSLLVGGRVVTLYHRPSGKALTPPVYDASCCRLARDGQVALVGTAGGEVRRFRVAGGKELTPVAAPGPVVAVDLSADGRLLLAASGDGSARLWDVSGRPAPLGPAVVAGGAIVEARFHGDDRSFFTLTEDGTVRLWPMPRTLTGPVEELERLVQVLTGRRVAEGGALTPMPGAEWRAGRKRLEPDSDLAAGGIAWHDARARDAWLEGDLFAARWHLDRLLKLQDADRAVFRRRGVVLARLGLFDAARKDQQRAAGGEADALVRELEYGLSRCQVAGDLKAAQWYAGELSRGAGSGPR
jgi:WD40 repeat protein